ncbi:MAG: class I SAM-dependent methyltransferase [Bacteroidales bacterium]|nr:class I SAM-dependent methyltransferase [Bacteroidales bacterium]
MKFPGNILYHFRAKKNFSLGKAFPEHILDNYFALNNYLIVEKYRKNLLEIDDEIEVTDFGTGSKKLKNSKRKIYDIADTSGTTMKFGIFFQKLIQSFKITSVLELGTSLGIGTLYFALSDKNIEVTSIEACPKIHNFTKSLFEQNAINNVNLINDDFDSVFDNNKLAEKKFDLVYIDGNHNSRSLLKYYDYIEKELIKEKCIFIIDDINWSTDMHKGWKSLCQRNEDSCKVYFFRMGIIFKNFNDLPVGTFPINFVN